MSQILCFVDTNVFICSRDKSEGDRQKQAKAWVDRLSTERLGRTSTQVLNEYFLTVTEYLDPGMSRKAAWDDVLSLGHWDPVPGNIEVLKRGHRANEHYQLNWWDAQIVAAAQACGCKYLLTENLEAGKELDGLTVINPFETAPGDLLDA